MLREQGGFAQDGFRLSSFSMQVSFAHVQYDQALNVTVSVLVMLPCLVKHFPALARYIYVAIGLCQS